MAAGEQGLKAIISREESLEDQATAADMKMFPKSVEKHWDCGTGALVISITKLRHSQRRNKHKDCALVISITSSRDSQRRIMMSSMLKMHGLLCSIIFEEQMRVFLTTSRNNCGRLNMSLVHQQ